MRTCELKLSFMYTIKFYDKKLKLSSSLKLNALSLQLLFPVPVILFSSWQLRWSASFFWSSASTIFPLDFTSLSFSLVICSKCLTSFIFSSQSLLQGFFISSSISLFGFLFKLKLWNICEQIDFFIAHARKYSARVRIPKRIVSHEMSHRFD